MPLHPVIETQTSHPAHFASDESVDQMIALAERLRAAHGGRLDDDAIAAIAEATGAPSDYVRLALKLRTDTRHESVATRLRAQYMTMEPDVRRFVVAGVGTTACAFLNAFEKYLEGAYQFTYGVFGMLALVFLTLGLYAVGLSRDARVAGIAGAILGGGYFAAHAVFAAIFRLPVDIPSWVLVPFTLLGLVGGVLLQMFVERYRERLGLKDPVAERQALLRQLVDIQEKLNAAEQHCTFLSLDIVGSTRMKEAADPLQVEFTFNEYHHFVARVTEKYGGRVHSTAGDGVICAFDNPQQAFGAARNIQTGLIELNTFRNKIGIPIVLRAGIHSGKVMTPQAGDITSVNFAHVIDIAAHLQKSTPPGGIAVSDTAALYLPGGPTGIGTERIETENIAATIWNPRQALPGAQPGAVPPAPESA